MKGILTKFTQHKSGSKGCQHCTYRVLVYLVSRSCDLEKIRYLIKSHVFEHFQSDHLNYRWRIRVLISHIFHIASKETFWLEDSVRDKLPTLSRRFPDCSIDLGPKRWRCERLMKWNKSSKDQSTDSVWLVWVYSPLPSVRPIYNTRRTRRT